ncbi:hypothetical protein FOMPIDRAFT_1026038 [Fomitopsis schrenkii]|uniref:Uncharacterized protein n=1 Tax=Fomitopsis schrenkii TaxID=2126942 RepID=S8EZA9_FOMSC|nr:hypothetical protein FOMPIDRAFT_1026038 [Fomitopsis schrenkii]
MRFASAFSFVLAAVAIVPAMAWRSSYQERSLNAYGEPLAARSWDDEGFVARDNYYTRSYEASELDARTSYDTYVDAGMQRREDAGLPVRELANLLYTRSARGRTTKHPVSVVQQDPGADGKYHWKLLIGDENASGTVWHDVVWSDDISVGMKHRGPKAYDRAHRGGNIHTWHIANIDASHIGQLNAIAKGTRTPKYAIADINKNCQTWVEDVIKKAVRARILPTSALAALARVPKRR